MSLGEINEEPRSRRRFRGGVTVRFKGTLRCLPYVESRHGSGVSADGVLGRGTGVSILAS